MNSSRQKKGYCVYQMTFDFTTDDIRAAWTIIQLYYYITIIYVTVNHIATLFRISQYYK